MSDEVTMGYELADGTQVNMHVGVHDWEGQAALADEYLHTLHIMTGHDDTEVPVHQILNTRYIVQNMKDALCKLEKKVDDLIAENAELQEKYDTLDNGFKVVTALNETLGQKNKELFDYAAECKAETKAYKDVLDKLKSEAKE